ncbi:type II toxin-antitoxin system HicA family toxin [Rhodobacteraceae bacterium]|nr:type II toxin-antitoxin system HicA family toxin [Paracoccaceae bacterium]
MKKGSHHQFKHPEKTGRVTVPHPNKNIKTGTVKSIYRQAGWI